LRKEKEMKKKYFIDNVGCDDETIAEFEFTQEEFEFLKKVFDELNTHSECGCMPTIHIKELVMCGECKNKEGEFWDCEYGGEERGYCRNCERRVEE
jgi:hypothetical protein